MFDWIKNYFDKKENERLQVLLVQYDEYKAWAMNYLKRKWWTPVDYAMYTGNTREEPGLIYTNENWEDRIQAIATLSSWEVQSLVKEKFEEAGYTVLAYHYSEFSVVNPNGSKEKFTMEEARNYFNI